MKNLSAARATVVALVITAVFAAALVFSPSGAASRSLVGTNIVVNSTSDAAADDGLCTLREAITSANNNTASGVAANECAAGTGGDMITFSVTGTISLTSALPGITSDMTVNGPGAKLLTVARSNIAATDFHVFTIYPGAVVSIGGLTITGGNDNLSAGGVQNLGTTLIDSCAISGNTGHAGGGISNEFNGNLTVYNSTISGNSSTDSGGGINNIAAVTVINSTISGNRTNLSGGGINTANSGSTLTIVNSTITDNHADLNDDLLGGGGGISISETVTTLRNTIVAGNSRHQASPTRDDVDGNLQAASSFNLIGDGTGMTGIGAGTGGNRVGTSVAPIDPLLAPLADNGGQTQTHALLAGSPAIDAGDNTLAKDAGSNTLTTDQRGTGFARIADSADADTTQTVDIGAFEAYPSVEDINDKTMDENSPLSFNFNVGDAVLGLTSVTAGSSNASLVPNDPAHISVTGTGSQRTLNITPAADANGTATITVTATASNGRTATDTFLLTVNAVNSQPTNIALSNNVVADNSPANTTVGTLSTTDPDAGDTFTYALVGGAGSLDNGSFAVSGSTLKTAAIIDYETKRTYSVRVRSTDSGGLSFEKVFLINVTDGPDTPGALSFSAANYNVNEADGSVTFTLRRTGGADNKAVARIGLADVTTSPNDYVFVPGSLDTSFNPGSGANNFTIGALALQPDGKIIIGGDFTTYNGVARGGIARLNTDGSLDTSFNPGSGTFAGLFPSVVSLALQPDGKILIGGRFNSYNGTAINCIARLNSDGSLDTSFNPGSGASDIVRALVLQPDGKILIGGDFNSYNGTSRNGIARLNADGSLDTSFNPGSGVDNSIRTLALQPDGKVIIGGDFTIYNGTSRGRIARLNADGALDTSFNSGSGANNTVWALALQPDGKILIGGNYTSYNGTSVNGLLRANSDGSRDASFNPGFVNQVGVAAITLQPDGKVIAGMFTSTGAQPTTLARLNTGG